MTQNLSPAQNSASAPQFSAEDIFFTQLGLPLPATRDAVTESLRLADGGELFLEYRQSENLVFDDGRLKTTAFDSQAGFGLRAISGEQVGYAHSSDLSLAAINRASAAVQAAIGGGRGQIALAAPQGQPLYRALNPLELMPFEEKVKLLQEIDHFARSLDPRVVQVSCALLGQWQAVAIIQRDGRLVQDIRPLVRMNVSVVVEEHGRREVGGRGAGGREAYERYFAPDFWQGLAREALAQALVNLRAIPCPAGEMTVVLGPGYPGVLLHEAVGHGLEGDFNRKETSAFANLIGSQVAAKGVTVVDDGTIAGRRGSLNVDDEGVSTSNTVLIEDGILKGYMQDSQNANLMGKASTGNGRRQSFAHAPMPRMTNTYMLGGNHQPDEIIASVKRGIYAVDFGGGQVDITSGKFVFSAAEAYLIEDGQIKTPVKGATLVGHGPTALKQISMIGNDMRLDSGIGTCGKDGQGVPVGVGQPTLRLDNMTVGGTEV
jgi:TldD protein